MMKQKDKFELKLEVDAVKIAAVADEVAEALSKYEDEKVITVASALILNILKISESIDMDYQNLEWIGRRIAKDFMTRFEGRN